MNRVIYTPDGEPIQVEWYISDGKATGVEAIRTAMIARQVGPPKTTGFSAPHFARSLRGLPHDPK